MKKEKQNTRWNDIDWGITLVPLVIIFFISIAVMFMPERAQNMISFLRNVFVNDLGFFYILLGLGILLLAIGTAFSKLISF